MIDRFFDGIRFGILGLRRCQPTTLNRLSLDQQKSARRFASLEPVLTFKKVNR
jgi:hypothetical protein